ncbi:MAG: PadR family transcriptional regulator [Bryobacteraceae bacterium]|nr:PadR family transcriptional regulator [Bryobacteraceae bacterium]
MRLATTELLKGTLDLLLLRALILQPDHGLGIARRVHQLTKGTFDVKAGSLFPALHRLEERGWLAAEWGQSENNRRAKYYRLTQRGRKEIENQMAEWERVSTAINWAITATS